MANLARVAFVVVLATWCVAVEVGNHTLCPEYQSSVTGYFPSWCATKNPFIVPERWTGLPVPPLEPLESCTEPLGLTARCKVTTGVSALTFSGQEFLSISTSNSNQIHVINFNTEKMLVSLNSSLEDLVFMIELHSSDSDTAVLLTANTSQVQVFEITTYGYSTCFEYYAEGSIVDVTEFGNGTAVALINMQNGNSEAVFLATGCGGSPAGPTSSWTLDVATGSGTPFGVAVVLHATSFVNDSSGLIQCSSAESQSPVLVVYSELTILVIPASPSNGVIPQSTTLSFAASSPFCAYASDNGTIASLDVFGDCLQRKGNPAQQLWLSFGLETTGGDSTLIVLALAEYASNAIFSPYAPPVAPCPAGQWKSPDGCKVRMSYTMPLEAGIVNVQTRFQEFVDDPLSAAGATDSSLWLYQVVFVTTSSRQVVVLGAQQEKCFVFPSGVIEVVDCGPSLSSLDVEVLSTLALTGDALDVYATPNAQHLFISESRGYWEQEAQQRFYNICQALVVNGCNTSAPRDQITCQFLAPYQQECNKLNPAPFNFFDFLQWFSMCPPLYLCPSMYYEVQLVTDPGYYAYRPQYQAPCPIGSFCALGQLIPCPPGYICPSPNMTLPQKCRQDPTFATTCYNLGLSAPQACPDGMVCLTPDAAPIPVPAGTFTIAGDRRVIVPCELSDYCPMQRFNSTLNPDLVNATDLACPALVYCEEPDIMIPSVCGQADYCPPGSTAANLCPAGYACLMPNISTPCTCAHLEIASNDPATLQFTQCEYCPAGTIVSTFCPAGFYCPPSNPLLRSALDYPAQPTLPATQVQCPAGFYCPAGFGYPIPCPYFAVCPAGSKSLSGNLLNWFLILGILVSIGVIFFFYTRSQARLQSETSERDRVVYSVAPQYHWSYLLMWAVPATTTVVIVGYEAGRSVRGFDVFPPLVTFAAFALFFLLITPARYVLHYDRLVVQFRWPLPSKIILFDAVVDAAPGVSWTPAMYCTSPNRIVLAQAEKNSALAISPVDIPSFLSSWHHAVSLSMALPESTALLSRGLTRKTNPLFISFQDLELTIPNGKKILSGVSGTFRPGRITAIMGPSGAGKTTVMSVISGKVEKTGGTILLNGKEDSISNYRNITGFVPQEDIMHRELTVREILLAQADLRLPADMSKSAREELVRSVIKILGLEDVQHSPIGDESKRGISGGQRKRVNIGMELVSDPTILFLDEPTSGLDSTASQQVLSCLRDVAEQFQLTIVTVIHQPRYEIFTMMHDCLLLGKGGHTVYLGECASTLAYFESLGFKLPAHCNPADFFLDIISGKVARTNHPEFRAPDLFNLWQSSEGHVLKQQQLLMEQRGAARSGKRVAPEQRVNQGFFAQFLTFLSRALLQQVRDMKAILLDNALVALAGGLMGLVYYNQSFVGPLPTIVQEQCPTFIASVCALPQSDQLMMEFLLVNMGLGITAVTASLRCFGAERIIFWRESSTGINPLSYFLAKNVAHMHALFIPPLILLSAYYNLTNMIGSFGLHYLVLVSVQFACIGVGYVVSIVIRPTNAQIAGVVFCFLGAMFCGANPRVQQLEQMHVAFLAWTSYLHWGNDALYFIEISAYAARGQVVDTAINFWGLCSQPGFCGTMEYCQGQGIESGVCLSPAANIFTSGAFMLLGMGLIARFLGYILMTRLNRDKQK